MLIADVSEPSTCSIFIGRWLNYFIHLSMKMELIEGSETSVISIVTAGNYPKENILHVRESYHGYMTMLLCRLCGRRELCNK